MKIDHIDHLVLTVLDIEASCRFYEKCGMTVETFGKGRTALHFGAQKINLHQAGNEFEPKAKRPTPGSADLCFIVATPIPEVIAHLQSMHIEILEGPVKRTGAQGVIISIYVRDPDGNLIEFSN